MYEIICDTMLANNLKLKIYKYITMITWSDVPVEICTPGQLLAEAFLDSFTEQIKWNQYVYNDHQ